MSEPDWHTSSYSTMSEPNCVEVAEGPDAVLVRDTANRRLGHLTLPAGEWAAFLAAVRCGDI